MPCNLAKKLIKYTQPAGWRGKIAGLVLGWLVLAGATAMATDYVWKGDSFGKQKGTANE